MSDVEALMRERLGEPDTVFVFPSEVAADWTLRSLLGPGGSALPRNTCVSWDKFKEETFASPEGRRPANGIVRRLFLEALLGENARRPVFRSLIPPEHAAAGPAHLSSLKPVLPLIGRTEKLLGRAGNAIDAAKRSDLALLAARYREFLDAAGLFEPDDAAQEFVPGKKTYLVFYPEVIEDWNDAAPALRGNPAVRAIGAGPGEAGANVSLDVFPGIEDEMSALMLALRALLDSPAPGGRINRIAVTAAGLDELALPLADAARRYDVPLLVNSGRPLAAYPGVNVLGQAAAAVASGYGLRALETLIGNRSVPWKDHEAADRLLRFGLENNCVRNFTADDRPFDLWEYHLRRAAAAGGRHDTRFSAAASFYRSLRTSLDGLSGAATFDEVKRRFTKFRAVFFEGGNFGDEERRCLELALDRLDELRETARALPLPPPASPFRVWLDVLSETRYVPPDREAGVPVYPYRVSAGIRPEHHFIVNVSEETTRVVVPPFPFLSVDEQARLGLADSDSSDAFLSLYGVSGKTVRMTGARAGFGRVRLPPPFFVRTGALRERLAGEEAESDGYAAEERFFLGAETTPPEPLFPLQAGGMAAAAVRTAAPGNRRASLFTESPVSPEALRRAVVERLSDGDGLLSLSPSDLERFTACAFRFLLEKAAGLEAPESDFAQDRAFWQGTFIHRVFERFFRRLKEERGRFEAAARARLRDDVLRAAEEEARAWEKFEPLPLPPLWRTMTREMAGGFRAFVDNTAEAFGDFGILSVEGAFSLPWAEKGLTLSGKIDLLGLNEHGLLIVDYKKNKAPSKRDLLPDNGGPVSFQIPCYVMLAEEGSPKGDAALEAGGRVAAASYYSFEKERYRHVLHPEAKAWYTADAMRGVIEGARAALASMADRIRAGDFAIGFASDRTGGRACRDCAFRAVCRRKYFLRFDD